VWVLKVRTLGLPASTSLQLHANLDVRARGMRIVSEWSMTTYSLPAREETVVQLVIRRRDAALRPDNVFLAWSRVVSRLFKHATLARRTWQEFPKPSGNKYHLYCDARAASGLFSAVSLRARAAQKFWLTAPMHCRCYLEAFGTPQAPRDKRDGMYFQRQHGLQCGLHAANNAVGAKVLIAADLNDAASEVALEMAVRVQDAQQRRSTATPPEDAAVLHKRMREMLVGPAGGQWAADCVVRALSKKGFHAHRRPVDDLALEGSWLVFGDKFHRADRPYAHAAALRDGLWLDSESSVPMLLLDCELPSFRPWTVYLVDRLPPPPAPPTEPVDLTSVE